MQEGSNKIISFLTIIIILCFACNPDFPEKDFKNRPPVDSDTINWINKWTVIGPFIFDSTKQTSTKAFFNNHLSSLGINERDFTCGHFKHLKKNNIPYRHILTNHEFLDFIRLSQDSLNTLSTCYAYASIESQKEKEVVLTISASSSYIFWLNHTKLCEIHGIQSNSRITDRFITVKLKKGTNHLFAKIGRDENQYAWKMIVGMSSKSFAKELFIHHYLSDFIVNPIASETLSLYSGPLTNLNIEVLSNKRRKSENENLNKITGKAQKERTNTSLLVNSDTNNFDIPIKDLKSDAFHICKIITENDTLSEPFYNGNINLLVRKLKKKSKTLLNTGIRLEEKADIISNLKRVEYMANYKLQDPNSPSEIKYVNKNRVFWAYSLQNYLENLEENSKPTTTHIKSYLAPKDSIENFLFHASSKTLKKDSIPLIMIVPYNLLKPSLIESWYIGNLSQIESDARLADENGVAICWLFMNGNSYTYEKGAEDANRVLSTLKKQYPISSKQVWLMGDCEGAGRALKLAVNNPELFAGLTLFAPALKTELYQKPIKKLRDKSIFISHGIHDHSSPIASTINFVKQLMKNGHSVEFEKTDKGHFNLTPRYREAAFKFIDKNLKIDSISRDKNS